MTDLIKKCKLLDNEFWKCLEKHQNMNEIKLNCGKDFYYLMNCINKIP